jgi:hypothetical protein
VRRYPVVARASTSFAQHRSCSVTETPPSLTPISPGEVHIWWTHLDEVCTGAPGTVHHYAVLLAVVSQRGCCSWMYQVYCRMLQVTPELLQQHHTELLTSEEVEHVYSTSDAAVQKARTVSRALLRSTLSKYLQGSHPQSLTFALNAHGKPRLMHPSNLGQHIQFNITHTESIVGEQHGAVTLAIPVDAGA